MAVPETKELRLQVPVPVLQVLDMMALSSGASSMTAFVRRELIRFAVEGHRRATMVARLPEINPAEMDSQWSDLP